jgi:dihydrofolate reductase
MTAIAAVTPSRVIGRAGALPWRLPADLRFFKQTTWGHVVVMGRRTYDSIGKPLPGRENWVITGGPAIAGTRCFSSPAEVAPPADGRRLYVIGGASIYAALLPRCSEILLTLLHREYEGDTFFPPYEDAFVSVEILAETDAFVIHRLRRVPGTSLS